MTVGDAAWVFQCFTDGRADTHIFIVRTKTVTESHIDLSHRVEGALCCFGVPLGFVVLCVFLIATTVGSSLLTAFSIGTAVCFCPSLCEVMTESDFFGDFHLHAARTQAAYETTAEDYQTRSGFVVSKTAVFNPVENVREFVCKIFNHCLLLGLIGLTSQFQHLFQGTVFLQ